MALSSTRGELLLGLSWLVYVWVTKKQLGLVVALPKKWFKAHWLGSVVGSCWGSWWCFLEGKKDS